MLRTPASAWPLWSVGLALAIAVVPLVMYSGHLYYAEGGTSPDAPGMLIASVIATAPIWIGAWMVAVALYLVRYPGAVRLTAWRTPSPLGALLAVLAVAGSLFFVWLAFARIEFWRMSRLPFTLHLLGCAAYLQYLRAAAVARSR